MKKSGLADSPFFKPTSKIETIASPSDEKENFGKKESSNRRKPVPPRYHDTMTPRHRDTMTPRNHDTTVSRYHDTTIESVRKVVKEFGKEAATHRFTLEEKKALAEIIHIYKKRNIKTSENEIARIGINFIVQEHKKRGKQSLLDLVIQALNR